MHFGWSDASLRNRLGWSPSKPVAAVLAKHHVIA